MPLVAQTFTSFGLIGWRVLKAVGTPAGDTPRYSIIGDLVGSA